MAPKHDLRLTLRFEGDRQYFHPLMHVVYVTDEGVRNPLNSDNYGDTAGLAGYADMVVTSQANRNYLDDGVSELYATDVLYRGIHSVDLRQVKRMATTLGKIEKRIEKFEEARYRWDRSGESTGFAERLGWIVEAIGCTAFEPIGRRYDNGAYEWMLLDQAVECIEDARMHWASMGYVKP